MDKSFNDQELSDIMKEIEALEDDFKVDDEKDSPVMAELANMDEAKALPKVKAAPMMKESSPASTAMSFKVQGDLTLELHFDIGGKVVSLEVTESGLQIQMEGGVTFTVPVANKPVLKKAV